MRSGVWCREAGVLLVREDPVYLIRDLDLTEGDRSPGRVHGGRGVNVETAREGGCCKYF